MVTKFDTENINSIVISLNEFIRNTLNNSLNIDWDNPITFSYFLVIISPKYDYEWTNKTYYSIDMIAQRHNCQTFVVRALYDFWNLLNMIKIWL